MEPVPWSAGRAEGQRLSGAGTPALSAFAGTGKRVEFVQLSVSALVSSPLPSRPRVLCRSCLTSKYRNGCPSHPKVPGPYRRPGGWGRCGGQGSCEALSLYASISQALWSGVGGGGLLTLAYAPSILGGPPGLAQPLDIRTLPLVLSSPSCPWAP